MGPMEIVLPEDRTLTITLDDAGIERLDPWPFAAGEVTVEIPWRVVPLDGYADDAALQAAIATAPVTQRRTLLQPA
jgi:hypothetical protein